MTARKQTVNVIDTPQTTACKTQGDKFVDLARAAECDEDEARWQERLKRVVKHKPKDVAEKPE